MLSSPALVRVSDSSTMPSLSKSPTQYVMKRPPVFPGGRLLLPLGDRNRHVERLAARPPRDPPDRRGVAGVETGAEADVAVVRAGAVRRVEADPAKPADPEFRPGVGGLVRRAVRRREEVARGIARGHPQNARGGDE